MFSNIFSYISPPLFFLYFGILLTVSLAFYCSLFSFCSECIFDPIFQFNNTFFDYSLFTSSTEVNNFMFSVGSSLLPNFCFMFPIFAHIFSVSYYICFKFLLCLFLVLSFLVCSMYYFYGAVFLKHLNHPCECRFLLVFMTWLEMHTCGGTEVPALSPI